MVQFIQKEFWRCFFVGKHKKWTIEQKQEIIKEFKQGATITYLNNKYGISGAGTVSRWNSEYDKGILNKDNRGRKKQEIEDIDILKKSYALLMEIRSQQNKQRNIKLLTNLEQFIQYQEFAMF